MDEISIKGTIRQFPTFDIENQRLIIKGRFLKVASVKDEEWIDGEPVPNPSSFITQLRRGTKADIFTFAQKPAEPQPKYNYFMEWDNAAAISIKSYAEWWNELPQETRRNVRKAAKAGVVVRSVEFTDDLLRGIATIYNETPVRQGKRFWHYGKDLETIRRENSTYLERSQFIGAFVNEELIGFIKMVYVDQRASIMQILAMNAHTDKRPASALIAKAVEISEARGVYSLVYCKYVYGKHSKSPLTEFKRRNGFEQIRYPRYFVALSRKGQAALALRLHQGICAVMPSPMWALMVAVRAKLFELKAKVGYGGPGGSADKVGTSC